MARGWGKGKLRRGRKERRERRGGKTKDRVKRKFPEKCRQRKFEEIEEITGVFARYRIENSKFTEGRNHGIRGINGRSDDA